MKLCKILFMTIVAAALVVSCSKSDVAGGATEDGNAVSGIVYSKDSIPAAGCHILLVDDSNWLSDVIAGHSPVIDSTTSDRSGHFRLIIPKGLRCNLQIDSAKEGLLTRGIVPDTSKTLVCKMKAMAALFGTANAESGTVDTIRLSGTTFSTIVSGGNYSLSAVPEGVYSVVASL